MDPPDTAGSTVKYRLPFSNQLHRCRGRRERRRVLHDERVGDVGSPDGAFWSWGLQQRRLSLYHQLRRRRRKHPG